MRILVVNRAIFQVPVTSSGGGAERHGYYLAQVLAQHGHQVSLVARINTPQTNLAPLRIHRVRRLDSIILPQNSLFGWSLKHLISNVLSFVVTLRVLSKDKIGFDVVHCHSALAALLLTLVLGRRMPVIYTMHDPTPWTAEHVGLRSRILRKLACLVIDVPCLRKVSHVIAVSPGLRAEAIRLGAGQHQVTFIPSGVNIPETHQAHPSIRGGYGLFVGRLESRKRVDLLIQVASKLNNHVRLLIVGDGPEKHSLIRMAKALQVTDRVSFAGYLDDERLKECYSNASFFVFPSQAEGFPLAILEAMSHGLPVITASSPSYEGILTKEVNSISPTRLDPEGLKLCIERFEREPDLMKQLSTAGMSLVTDKFTWPVIADRIASIFQNP